MTQVRPHPNINLKSHGYCDSGDKIAVIFAGCRIALVETRMSKDLHLQYVSIIFLNYLSPSISIPTGEIPPRNHISSNTQI